MSTVSELRGRQWRMLFQLVSLSGRALLVALLSWPALINHPHSALCLPVDRSDPLVGETAPLAKEAEDIVLSRGRVRVRTDWRSQYTGQSGHAAASPFVDPAGFSSDEAATFMFPAATALAPDLFVKVLDFGSSAPFLLFWGGLTDFEYTVTFENLETGAEAQFTKPAGEFGGGANTSQLKWSLPRSFPVTLICDSGPPPPVVTFAATDRYGRASTWKVENGRGSFSTEAGSDLTLTGEADWPYVFRAFTSCTSEDATQCLLHVDSATEVHFTAADSRVAAPTVSLTKSWSKWGGSVVLLPFGLACPDGCQSITWQVPSPATRLELKAQADTGSIIGSWSGCLEASGDRCLVSRGDGTPPAANVVLQFDEDPAGRYPLTVELEGWSCGIGSVSSTPPAVFASNSGGYRAYYEPGTDVSLRFGSCTFPGGCVIYDYVAKSLTGCDSVSDNVCLLKMTSGRHVSARYDYPGECPFGDIKSFVAIPSTIKLGQSSVLEWSVCGTAGYLSDGTHRTPLGSSPLTVSPVITTTYTIEVFGRYSCPLNDGTKKSVTVTVQ